MNTRVVLAITMSLLMSAAWAKQTIVLNSSFYAPLTSEKQDGVLDLIYQQLSKRLGIHIEIQNLTASERCLRNADSGIVDGDVARVAGLEKIYPNLMRVPVPVMKYEMVGFSRKVDFKMTGAEGIKPYNIGVVRGWKILEQAAAGAHSVTSLESADQMFMMLDKNRIDIALLEKLEGLQIIKSMDIKGVRVLQPNLYEGEFYLYLNRKHAAMIPLISAELLKMAQEGVLQHIYDSVLMRYAKSPAN